MLAALHPIPKRLIQFDFGDWSVLDLGSVLISAVNGHELAAMRSAQIHVIRELWGTPKVYVCHFSGVGGIEAMDSAKHCRDQAAECLRLMKSTKSEAQAQVLRNISSSWSRLAGQIDRYNALAREQPRK